MARSEGKAGKLWPFTEVKGWATAALEPLLLAAAAPFLLTASPLAPYAAGALAVPWVIRGFRQRGLPSPGYLTSPLIFLLVTAAWSLYPSLDLSFSWPKFWGIVLQVATFLTIVTWANSSRRWALVAGALVLATLVMAGVGLTATQAPNTKFLPAQLLYSRMPRLDITIIGSTGVVASGIHPNEMGGTLAFLLPLAVTLALGARGWWARGATIMVSLAGLVALFVVQSRSSILAVGVALLFAAMLWERRWIPWLGGGLLAAVAAVVLSGPQQWVSLVLDMPGLGAGTAGVSAAERIEIWNGAALMLQDFPFTGIGLNTFPLVAGSLYSLTLESGEPVVHVHNVFLQTGVDLGLPGLASFLAFLFLWFRASLHRLPHLEGWERSLLVGCVAGSAAYMVYGLTDAITLGAKPLVLWWALLGLGAAMHGNGRAQSQRPRAGWFLQCLAGIAAISIGLMLGLQRTLPVLRELPTTGLDWQASLWISLTLFFLGSGLRWLARQPP